MVCLPVLSQQFIVMKTTFWNYDIQLLDFEYMERSVSSHLSGGDRYKNYL